MIEIEAASDHVEAASDHGKVASDHGKVASDHGKATLSEAEVWLGFVPREEREGGKVAQAFGHDA